MEKKKATPSSSPKTSPVEETTSAVSDAIEEVFREDRGLELDGNPFWVVQRIFWGILKSVGILGIAIFLIWMIWGVPKPDSFSLNAILPEKGDSQEDTFSPSTGSSSASEPESKPPSAPEEGKKEALQEALPEFIAYQAYNDRLFSKDDTVIQSIIWLKKAKALGESSFRAVRIASPRERAQKISELLLTADMLEEAYKKIEGALLQEFQYYYKKGQDYNEKIDATQEEINQALKTFHASAVPELVSQKITFQKKAAEALSQAKIRNTLIQNMRIFMGLLRKRSLPLLRQQIPLQEWGERDKKE